MPINSFMREYDAVKNGASKVIKQPDAGLQPVTQPVETQSVNPSVGATSPRYNGDPSKPVYLDEGGNVTPAKPVTPTPVYTSTPTPTPKPTPTQTQTTPTTPTTPKTAATPTTPAAAANAATTEEGSAPAGLTPDEANALAAAQRYQGSTLRSYLAQEDAVNALYKARQKAQLQALRDAYDQNMLTYQAAREDIAPVFEAQRNATAAESERQRAAFNEYAAARGLNSGAGGQAELARGNVLAGNLNALNTEQARQETEIDRAIAALKAQYQNAIAQAKAGNDYQRLADLLTEYRTQEQSLVSTSLNQASEDYKTWAANYNMYRDSVSDQQWADQFAYQKERDAVSDNQWERQFNYTVNKSKSSGSSGRSYSGGSGGGAGGNDPTSPIEYMLSLGDDGKAYAYLLGLGYKSTEANNYWKIYKAEKEQRTTEAQAEQTAGDYEPPYPIVESPLKTAIKNSTGGSYTQSPTTQIPTSYDGAVNYLKANGAAGAVSGLLSETMFNGAKAGQVRTEAGTAAAGYDTYQDYLEAYIRYALGK